MYHKQGRRSSTALARTYSQPLGVVDLAGAEQSLQGIVTRNDEACKVHQELATNIEEDKEEVETDQAKESIDLRHAGLSLEVVKDRVLGELRTSNPLANFAHNKSADAGSSGNFRRKDDAGVYKRAQSHRVIAMCIRTSLSIWEIWC